MMNAINYNRLLKFCRLSCTILRRPKSQKKVPPKNIILNDKKTKFGSLKDEDRIFQNLYGRRDWRLKGACQRGDWHRTKDLICKGPDWTIEQISKCGLRGRGGAGFYVYTKWNFLRLTKDNKPKLIVMNAAEGEPGTCKDREILRHEPHKMIEGLLLAGLTMGANRGIIYVRSKYYNEACNLQFAVAEAYRYGLIGKNACGSGHNFQINVQRGDRYVCGEETALINCLMGKQGRPRRKPPFLIEKGYFENSTIVINAETLAVLPTILRRGPEWFASLGRSYNAGTKLFNISGHVNDPCTVEEEMSTPIREIIEKHAGGVIGGWDNLALIFPGGSSTPLINRKKAEIAIADFDGLEEIGSALGSGAIIVVNKDADLLEMMHRTIKFYKIGTCKQCTECREGSIWLTDLFKKFAEGNAQPQDVNWVSKIADFIDGKTICALGESQAALARGMVEHCRDVVEERIKKYSKG